MPRWFTPILTQQKHASFGAIVAINLLWFCNLFQVFATTNALVFTLRRYTENPQLIAIAASVNYVFGFFLGPACNYLSDRIWTRIGRRKPFIVIGWSATAVAMLLIPFMPSYGALMTVIIFYNLIGDMATPVEPLCMEVVPSHQRGRSMAVRQICVQAAVLLYFQVLFPRFDDNLTVPFLNGVTITGEQLIYGLCSLLFFLAVAFLLIGVREIKDPAAPNIELRDLPFAPVQATKTFLRETFGDRRWWWIYLLYCAVSGAGAAWNLFELRPLLLTQDFGYAKADIALMGLPATILGLAIVMPLMGWYSDKQPALSRPVLIALGAVCGAFLWQTLTTDPASASVALPPLWRLMVLALALTGLVCAFYLLAAQALLRWTGGGAARVWLFMVSIGFQILHGVACWWLVRQAHAEGRPGPSLLAWFLIDQLRYTLRACTDVLTGPVFFDFVPRDRMGTLSSGFGFTNSLMLFGLTNLAGYWVTTHSVSGNGYSSLLVLQTIVAFVALVALGFFVVAFRRGTVREYGRLGLTAND